jgi:hypothetical protein
LVVLLGEIATRVEREQAIEVTAKDAADEPAQDAA